MGEWKNDLWWMSALLRLSFNSSFWGKGWTSFLTKVGIQSDEVGQGIEDLLGP